MFRLIAIGASSLLIGPAIAADDRPAPAKGSVSCRCICSSDTGGASVTDILGTGNWGDRPEEQCKKYSRPQSPTRCQIAGEDGKVGTLKDCSLFVHLEVPEPTVRPAATMPEMQTAPRQND